jgi:hypothetical protein
MLHGGCFCGYVRYEASGIPFCETNCHCSICRRSSGAPFVAWFSVQRAAFLFTAGEPASIRSSEHATRTFCPRCGTPLTFASDSAPEEVDVTQCSLDQPEAVPPKDHTYVRSKLPWVTLCDDLPTYPAQRNPPSE